MSNDDSIMTNDSSANNSLMTEDEDEKIEPQTGTNIPKKSKYDNSINIIILQFRAIAIYCLKIFYRLVFVVNEI